MYQMNKKMYQMLIKYPKSPLNIPKGHNIYINIFQALRNLPKIWIFGLKSNPLATQPATRI
jgi:hypothetical protein